MYEDDFIEDEGYFEYENDDDYLLEDEDEDENAFWDDEEDSMEEADASSVRPKKKRKKKMSQLSSEETEKSITEHVEHQLAIEQNLIDEMEAEAEENPIEEEPEDDEPERKKLKRELRAEALARLEDAARTTKDFENIISWWDKLDSNRERRERYHELSRSGDDLPLDYGASANELYFPDTLNNVLEKQIRKGDFIDAIFYCPYDIHELVTEEYLSRILCELTEDHKELLFLCAVRLFSSTRIAAIRGQTDRNIRKVRVTMLKKIRKKLLPTLTEKAEKQQKELTLLEKDFLAENNEFVEDENKK